MKVLFICSGNNRLGVTPFIKSQGESLIEAGVEIEYFVVSRKGFIGYTQAIIKLNRYLKKSPVNLIHAHYALCGWVAYWVKTKRNPLVLSYMGSDILPVNSGKGVAKAILTRANRFLQKKVDHVIVKSENLKNVLNVKSNLSVIPNGVNINQFKPFSREECRRRLGFENDKKIVLFLGDTQDYNKNYKLVIDAIHLLPKGNMILVSPFPVDPDQVPFYINAADVFILSSFSEGSPNVLKEAMACNCPIVATDVGDVRWIMSGVKGCFMTSYSPEDMAINIKLALDFDKKTIGRERIMKLGLDSGAIAKRIISVYEAVLNK